MKEESLVYCVMLEDYYYPRTASVAKAYYSTLEDWSDFSETLSENRWTARRYGELIFQLDEYDGSQAIFNTVAGVQYPLLVPMREVCRYRMTLTDQNWVGIGYSGAYNSFAAERVEVIQILLRTQTGYRRCMKAAFTNLRICIPHGGWVRLNGATKGFPGVLSHENGATTMNLFVDQQYYALEDLAQALADVKDSKRIDLTIASGDVIGEM